LVRRAPHVWQWLTRIEVHSAGAAGLLQNILLERNVEDQNRPSIFPNPQTRRYHAASFARLVLKEVIHLRL
jgi:cobalamin biosynthesis protein CobT